VSAADDEQSPLCHGLRALRQDLVDARATVVRAHSHAQPVERRGLVDSGQRFQMFAALTQVSKSVNAARTRRSRHGLLHTSERRRLKQLRARHKAAKARRLEQRRAAVGR
jgi:hypothetical protein